MLSFRSSHVSVALHVLASCIGAFLFVSPAQATDRNCNKIQREQEKDPAAPGMDCVDITQNGNSCTRSPTVKSRPCDDYVPMVPGQAATCSTLLAADKDGDGFGDTCDNCPGIYNPD